MSGRVAGRSVIITGAGNGIGRAFALAQEGAIVGVLDLDEAAAAEVSWRDQVVAAFDMFLDRTGRLDVLFNNAGFNRPMKLLDVNALGTLIGIRWGPGG